MTGKKLVMVLYFAPWCPNWRNEAPVAASLYEKYKAQGFEIVGVSEYGSRDDVKNFFGPTWCALSRRYRIRISRRSREDTALRLSPIDGRYAQVGFAMEYFS